MKTKALISIVIVSLSALTSFGATATITDYNPYDYNIPENGSTIDSDLSLSGTPADAQISKVKVYYEIKHNYIGDLKVWLTAYYDGTWHDYIIRNRQGGSADDIADSIDDLTTWNGASPNQTWYLVAQDLNSGVVGYIDFFQLWIDYTYNTAPNTPKNEDPDDGATGISITTDLDWSCTDPEGDTLNYTVYFDKNDSTPNDIIKDDETGSDADPGNLDYASHYYWKVKADDNKGGITWSPVWDFYTEPVPVEDGEITGVTFDKSAVVRGSDTITATVTIHNTGNQQTTFYLGGSSIKDGDTTWYDWYPARASKTLNAGDTGTVGVSWDCPSGAPVGSYGFYSKLYKSNSGDDFYDYDWRADAFQVEEQILPAIDDGRLAWHSYTEYDDDDGDGYRSIDGKIWIYDFNTATHNTRAEATIAAGVQHAINPNFSEDGRYITFMGLPKTRTYSHYASWAEYLDIFVYDFRDDNLINISALAGRGDYNEFEEDPVFSPDGQWIAFKYQRNDIWAVRLSDYHLRQVTAGTGEESGPQYSPDGNWITFWVGDGSEALIAKVPAGSESETTYTLVVDNDGPGDTGIQDYFPSYWDSARLIYTSWDTPQSPGSNDDDDIHVRNLSTAADYSAAFNSSYPIDDSDAFPISSTLLGYSKRDGPKWVLWYGDPVVGGSSTLGISDAGKHNLGGELCPQIIDYIPNNVPSDIAISSSSVAENQPSDTSVGTLSTTDPDTGNTFSYTLVSGFGSSDNTSFSINGDVLETVSTFNYESKNSYGVRIRTTDQGGLWLEENFTLSIEDVNEAPTALLLSSSSVEENLPSGSDVGTFTSSDPDSGNTFIYSLVSGSGSTDNSSFSITGDNLRTSSAFNYEGKSSYSVRVRTADQGGLLKEKSFTIQILDMDEAPAITAAGIIDGSNYVFRWSSVFNNSYSIYYSTNLLDGFYLLNSNLTASPPENVFTGSVDKASYKFWRIDIN
jgi:subtilisin-like proprotein convertase family protein